MTTYESYSYLWTAAAGGRTHPAWSRMDRATGEYEEVGRTPCGLTVHRADRARTLPNCPECAEQVRIGAAFTRQMEPELAAAADAEAERVVREHQERAGPT